MRELSVANGDYHWKVWLNGERVRHVFKATVPDEPGVESEGEVWFYIENDEGKVSYTRVGDNAIFHHKHLHGLVKWEPEEPGWSMRQYALEQQFQQGDRVIVNEEPDSINRLGTIVFVAKTAVAAEFDDSPGDEHFISVNKVTKYSADDPPC